MSGLPNMPEERTDLNRQALRLCASEDLSERGQAVVFRVRHFRHELSAFVLRVDGKVVGYLNRCVHVPVEMDWQLGEFWDSSKQLIICSLHGAVYSPHSGHCLGGPCGRGKLTPIEVNEVEGQVYWYPSEDIVPVTDTAP